MKGSGYVTLYTRYLWVHCAWKKGIKQLLFILKACNNYFLTALIFSNRSSWWIMLSKTSKIFWYAFPLKISFHQSFLVLTESKQFNLKCVCIKIAFKFLKMNCKRFLAAATFQPLQLHVQLRVCAAMLSSVSDKCWHSQHVSARLGCWHCQQLYMKAAPFQHHH